MTVKYKTTTITMEATMVYCSRLINNKQYKLEVPINAIDVNDLLTKCVRVSKLDDSMFVELSRIQRGAIEL